MVYLDLSSNKITTTQKWCRGGNSFGIIKESVTLAWPPFLNLIFVYCFAVTLDTLGDKVLDKALPKVFS